MALLIMLRQKIDAHLYHVIVGDRNTCNVSRNCTSDLNRSTVFMVSVSLHTSENVELGDGELEVLRVRQ
jgi:hypothetical protein